MPFTLPEKPEHGVNIPLFSLRSCNSCGIGEYLDLIPMVEWCREVGFSVIQLLPLNDTGEESSPYCALTSTALNPIHLSLSHLPGISQYPHLEEHLHRLQSLNNAPFVEYKKVFDGKMQFLREYYGYFHQQIFEHHDFKQFYYDSDWLKGYALFKAMKHSTHWKPWEEWDVSLRNGEPEAVRICEEKFEMEIDFHIFVQFLCFRQMKKVRDAAEAAGISLMGDIPILISRESADVWLNRDLFDLTMTAGAPPDQYSREGQNWGFPLYHWEAHQKQDYTWWKNRLKYAESLYHLYRIDHVVGFFRIWGIPLGAKATEGHFVPEEYSQWIGHGDAILKMMIEHSTMIPIAEDLGTVPDEVRSYMRERNICGTRVMRWERHWHTDRSYIPVEEYIKESLTTVSTHDSTLLTEWWREQPEESGSYAASRGWAYLPTLTLEQRKEILKQSHHTGSLYHVNLLNEYLNCIPELAWKLPEEERINTPGVISTKNWTTKFAPTVEEIVTNGSLKELIRSILLTLLFICLPLEAESEAHIKMLYSSLNPTSISQHLAFYQLYPQTEFGRKALSDAWKLLGKGQWGAWDQQDGELLAKFPEVTASLVALINQKESEPVLLEEGEIKLIERLGASLPNRKLRGYGAQTEEEVIRLPSDEVDLARGLFLTLFEKSPEGIREMKSYEALLDLMALQVLATLPEAPTPRDKIRAMNELIFFEMGYRFPPQSVSIKDIDVYTFLPSVLNSRKGVCLGVSILYLCLAQRLDLPLEMVTPPGHIYVRYKNGKEEVNIETTCRGVHIDSDEYLSIETCALEQQNIKQVIGLAYVNQASVFLGKEQFDLAENAYKKALPYHPDQDVLHRFLGISLCLNGKEQEGREHLEKCVGKMLPHQVSPDTLAEDYLEGKINAQGIARFVKHVDSTRTALMAEKEGFEKILAEYPQFRAGWLALAGTWLELGNERQALRALEQYHALDCHNSAVEFYLANLYAKRLDFDKAWVHLRRCEEITAAKDYTPDALKDFREQLQQVYPE